MLFTIQLAQAASLEVQVVDVDDIVIESLPIILSPLDSDIELHITTDIKGKGTFSGLDHKGYALILKGFEDSYYQVDEHIEITEETNFYKLVVREKASLTIQVLYEDESPAENVRVILESESGAYKEMFKKGHSTDYEGYIIYPFGVAEDSYTVILNDEFGNELVRYSEFISADIVNVKTYYIEKTSPIPSFPIYSLAVGMGYWILRKRPR